MHEPTPHRSELDEPGTPLWFRVYSVVFAIASALFVGVLIATK
jgi:hypothetical protein